MCNQMFSLYISRVYIIIQFKQVIEVKVVLNFPI